MKKNYLFVLTIFLTFVFFQCEKNDEVEPRFDPELNFNYSISNNGIAPCSFTLIGFPEQDEDYTLFLNDEYKGTGDTISFEIMEEGYHEVYLRLGDTSSGYLYTDTTFEVFIFGQEYSLADSISAENMGCTTFNFDSITFYFGDEIIIDSNDRMVNPLFHPLGDPDVGERNILLDGYIDRIVEFDINKGVLSGWGIWEYDIQWHTEKIAMDFNMKFYIQFEENCISSVKAYNYEEDN